MTAPFQTAWPAPAQPAFAPAGDKPDGPKRVRVKLDTIEDIRKEAATLYRKCRSNEISPDLAGELAFLLQTVARLTEQAETERKLEELENRIG